jgi:uroporphyrin-III C-methyltransferase
MADNGSQISRASGLAGEPPPVRRVHSYGRFTTAVAVLALATSIYALLRLDSTRDRLDQVKDTAVMLEAERKALQDSLTDLANRARQAQQEQDRRLAESARQLQELGAVVEEIRGRASGSERAWSRAEAMFLVELAQRRLVLDRDVETAVVALESADARLAALRDSSFSAARQQIARDLQALRAVRRPDIAGILVRLGSAEERAIQAPVKGLVVLERSPSRDTALPEGMFARAWAIVTNTLRNLISVREVDDREATIVTMEEQLLRRQHLQLLLFAARTAAVRHDNETYRGALASARRWLGEFFDLDDPGVASLLAEVQALEPIDVDPQLPDVSASLRLLQRMMPARGGPE